MSNRKTSMATRSATSSPESADGHSQPASPGGRKTASCGPARARASRSAPSESAKASTTSATSGPSSATSLQPVGLQQCLENRLQARMGVRGSPEYALTWRHWAMKSGLPICALRASPRRTSASGFIGWVTPTTRDWKDTPGMATTAGERVRLDQLPRQAAQYLGTPSTQSLIGTEEPVAVNPELARWLCGFPRTWDACAPTAMPSSRKSRQK